MKKEKADSEPYAIDAIDHRLIALLRKDGRASTRNMARALGITEATVRSRLRRLEETQTLRVVAMTDFRAAGIDLIASIGVQVKGRPVTEVAANLAKMSQVLDVHIVVGTPDIEISVAAKDREELAVLLTDTLIKLPGVFRLDAGVALDVYKLQWGWVPFL